MAKLCHTIAIVMHVMVALGLSFMDHSTLSVHNQPSPLLEAFSNSTFYWTFQMQPSYVHNKNLYSCLNLKQLMIDSALPSYSTPIVAKLICEILKVGDSNSIHSKTFMYACSTNRESRGSGLQTNYNQQIFVVITSGQAGSLQI